MKDLFTNALDAFLANNLHAQVLWPVWQVNTIGSRTHVVSELNLLTRETDDWARILYHFAAHIFDRILSKMTRLEQHASTILEDLAKDLGQHVRHTVVVTEDE